MSEKTNYPARKSLVKEIGNVKIYLGRSFDLVNGFGIFCQVYRISNRRVDGRVGGTSVGNGFHKTNKFIAIKKAINELYSNSDIDFNNNNDKFVDIISLSLSSNFTEK